MSSPVGEPSPHLRVVAEPGVRRRREDVLRPLPRRGLTSSVVIEAVPPMAKVVRFEASTLRSLWRLFVWCKAVLRFALGTTFDLLLFRDTARRRARRLRRLFERNGPTAVKIGQYLAFRADILPLGYCEELGEITDRAPAFETARAIEAIEKVAGRPIREVFAVFDPTPITATTSACVYQATLPDGQQVAIKVRRPDITRVYAADLRAFTWMLAVAERCALLRPGRTRLLREELVFALSESLNYTLEARYNEIFARRARKKQQDHIQAPAVFFELSSDDVLVTEFVAGVFLWEILDAVEGGDEPALAAIAARGVDPGIIAQHLTRSFYWEALENVFFHADPHPAKIVARPDNSLVFVDFAPCGRFSEKVKRYYEQLQRHIAKEDVWGMVEATISMLEPLPPVDLDRFTKDVEGLYWDWLYATKSRHAPWWERSTGELWMKVVDVARRYGVPVHIDILRMFRATLIYDGMAMRLSSKLKLEREYRAYSKERGRRARRRVRRAMRRRMEKGLTSADYLALQDLTRLVSQVANRSQLLLDRPAHRFVGMIGKAAFGVSMVLKILIAGGGLHVLALLASSFYLQSTGRAGDVASAITFLLYHPAYQVSVALLLLIVIRRALMRLEDIDVNRT